MIFFVFFFQRLTKDFSPSGISANVERVDEPSNSEGSFPVTIKVTRRDGLRGVVAVRWNVTILPAPTALSPEADPKGPGANKDVDIFEDTVYFVSDESVQEFTVKVNILIN